MFKQRCPSCGTDDYSAYDKGKCYKCGYDLTGVTAEPAESSFKIVTCVSCGYGNVFRGKQPHFCSCCKGIVADATPKELPYRITTVDR